MLRLLFVGLSCAAIVGSTSTFNQAGFIRVCMTVVVAAAAAASAYVTVTAVIIVAVVIVIIIVLSISPLSLIPNQNIQKHENFTTIYSGRHLVELVFL